MAMNDLSDITYVKKALARHGFSFSKALGQNFIIDPSVCPKIAESGNARKGTGIIEIGAGAGVLTRELAVRADKVVSYEIDKRLLPVLEETLAAFHNISIINADFMECDLGEVIEREFAGLEVSVCANLPYYITSPAVIKLLESRLPIRSVTVMVQKEAAERLCAADGTREAGAVTYFVRYYSEPEMLFEVTKDCFLPQPKVDSAVIRFNMLSKPPIDVSDEKFLFGLIRGAFSQRRKTAANAVSAALGTDKAKIISALESCGIEPAVRPERITLAEYGKLAEFLKG